MRQAALVFFALVLTVFFGRIPVAQSPSDTLVLRGGNVIDVASGRVLADTSIVIRSSRINRILPTAQLEIPVGAEVVEVAGKFLIPGLIDMHTHYRDWVPELFIAQGITSVRDCGNQLTWILAEKQAQRSGLLDQQGTDWMSRSGPRIFALGAVNTFPNGRGHHYKLKSVEEARSAVDMMAQRGVDGFKGLPGLSLEMIKAISERAATHGLKLTAHFSSEVTVRDAVLAGIQGIEHDLDLTKHPEAEAMDTVKLMARKGVYWDPMIAYGYHDVIGVPIEDAAFVNGLLARPDLKYLPDTWRKIEAVIYPAGGAPPQTTGEKAQRFQMLKRLVKSYVDQGGRLLPGTDSPSQPFTGFSLHKELETFVTQVGLTPAQALQTATVNAAEALNVTDLGRLAVGARADVLVLNLNPLQDIKNTRNIAAVYQNGRRMSQEFHPNFVQLLPRPILPGSTVFIGESVLKKPSQ